MAMEFRQIHTLSSQDQARGIYNPKLLLVLCRSSLGRELRGGGQCLGVQNQGKGVPGRLLEQCINRRDLGTFPQL